MNETNSGTVNNGVRIFIVAACAIGATLQFLSGGFLVASIIFSLGLGNLFLLLKKGDPDSFLTLGAYLMFLLCAILGVIGMLYGLKVFGS